MVEWTLAYWTSTAGLMILAILGLVLWKAKIVPRYARFGRNLSMIAGGLWAATTFGLFSIGSMIGGGAGAIVTAPLTTTFAGCPDTKLTTITADAFAKSNSTGGEYLATTLSFYPVNADGTPDVDKRYTYTTAPSATRATGVNLPCGYNYVAYAATIRDNATGLFNSPVSFAADAGAKVLSVKLDEVAGAAGLTVRGYDVENSAFIYGNDSLDGTNTAYETVRTTLQSTTNNTAIVFGLDGTVKWKLQFATTAGSGLQMGGAQKTWACFDRAAAEVDKPVSVTFNGVELSEAKATMNSNDQAQLSGFEDCYVLPRPINDVQGNNDLVFSLKAKGGQNPSTDLVWRVMGEDMILDQDGKTLVSRIFRPSDARQEVNSRDFSTTIDIS